MRHNNYVVTGWPVRFITSFGWHQIVSADMQEKTKARLQELAPRAQREPGGGIHAT